MTVAGTEAVELVIPRVAAQIKELKHQRTIVADEVEKLLDDFPLSRVLMSMPGVGIKTAATILLTIGDASSFNTAGHLAAYAGIAPVTRRSGTSIRGEFPARSGNKQLKNALFRSAWIASCHDPHLQGLLRPETRRRKETQRRRHLPGPPPLRRHLRHAQKRDSLPGKDSPRPLDQKHKDAPHFPPPVHRVAARDPLRRVFRHLKRQFPGVRDIKGPRRGILSRRRRVSCPHRRRRPPQGRKNAPLSPTYPVSLQMLGRKGINIRIFVQTSRACR